MLESMLSGTEETRQGVINSVTSIMVLAPVRKGVINTVSSITIFSPTRKGVINSVTGLIVIKESK